MPPIWFQRWSARPRFAACTVLLGVLLCAPSLGNGLSLDDVLQAARAADGTATAWNLFNLFGGEDPLVAPADAPWWAHDAMRLALLRPLAALTHLLDLRWLAASPAAMHLHSLLWYALLLALAGRVYRRFMPTSHAWGLALLLYAIDHSHGMVVGWLAARSAVLGAIGALVCLWAHDRWRRDARPRDAVLAAGALVVALLANEGALGVCGYLAAYALCLDRGPLARRVATLLPAAAIAIVWRVCYVAAGYGAAHGGFYFDPTSEGAWFVGRALAHASILVGSAVFVPLGEPLAMAPGLIAPGAVIIAVLLAAIGALLRDDLRRSPTLRFWALGTVLCALPLGTTLPTDRQLMLIGFGVFGFVGALASERAGRTAPRPVRWLAWAWLGLHCVLSPLLLPLRAMSPAVIHRLADDATAKLVGADPARSVILVRAPSDLLMLYGRASSRLRSTPFPRELQYLYAGLAALTITRVDERTLELRPEHGWLSAPIDRLHRAPSDGFHVGEQIHHDTMTIEVLEITPDGRPLAIRVRLDRPLEDPTLAWYTWEGRASKPHALPRSGETHTLAAQPNPMLAP